MAPLPLGWSLLAMIRCTAWICSSSMFPWAAAAAAAASECEAAGCQSQDVSALLQGKRHIHQSPTATPKFAYFCKRDYRKNSFYKSCEVCPTEPVCCDVNQAKPSNDFPGDVRCTERAHGITAFQNCAHLEFPSICPNKPNYAYFCKRDRRLLSFYRSCETCATPPVCCDVDEARPSDDFPGDLRCTEKAHGITAFQNCAHQPYPDICPAVPIDCENPPAVNPCDPAPQPPQYADQLFKLITCPVIGALFRNGDLVPDGDNKIKKEQTLQAFLRAGISCETARETTDGNFDHQRLGEMAEVGINIFEMNLKVPHVIDPALSLEHDFSTGIRDFRPSTFRFKTFEAAGMVNTDVWTPEEVNKSITFFENVHNSFDLGPPNAPGTLMAIDAMLKEFGNESADGSPFLSREDMENLFLHSNYTPAFSERLRQRRQQAGCSAAPLPPPPSPLPSSAPVGDPSSVSPCDPAPQPGPQYADQLVELITCPVIAALFRNGDLVPDSDNKINKEQTLRAFLRVGISYKTARETVDGNFDHQRLGEMAGVGINIFEMNLKVPHVINRSLSLEHDFSTGIRDEGPSTFRFKTFEAAGMVGTDVWTPEAVNESINFFNNVHNSFDLGPANAPGTLMAIDAMLKEFGDKSADGSPFLSQIDMENLFLHAQYTPAFSERLRQRRQQAGC